MPEMGLDVLEVIQRERGLLRERIVVIREASVDQVRDPDLCIDIHYSGEEIVSLRRGRIFGSEIPQMVGVNVHQKKVVEIAASRCLHFAQDIAGDPFSGTDVRVRLLCGRDFQ